jgi:hypothetical protein
MFKYLDFFSEGVNLNVGGHAVFRTVYGSLFTVVYLGIMIFIVVMNAGKYLDKTNPVAVGEVYTREAYPEINLRQNKLSPVLVAFSDETTWITADQLSKYFTVVTQKIIWDSVLDSNTNEVILEKKFETYPTLPCSQIPEDERKKTFDYMGEDNYYYQTLSTYGLCSQIPTSASIIGSSSDDHFSIFTFKVLPCSLSSGCADASQMSTVNFQLLLPYSNLKVNNEGDPHDFKVAGDEIYYVTPSLRQIYTAQMKELNVFDFEGFFPSWRQQDTVYDIHSKVLTMTSRTSVTSCTSAQVAIEDNQACLPYFEFNVQSSGVVVNSKRTYISLFDTLGAIGGTNGVIIVILLMLYGPINEKKRREYMTRKIYSLVGVKEEDLEKGMDFINRKKQARSGTGVQAEGVEGQSLPQTQTQIKIERDRRRWWTYICCCCRKKTATEIEWEKKVNRAHQKIVDSLDVLTIVRNFNELKVLTHFFFGERHFDMAQYVGFDLWQEECEKREKRKKELLEDEAITNSQLADERRNLRRVRISKRIVTEKQRFNHWMEFIKNKHQQRSKDSSEVTSELGNELDEFYYQKLYDSHNKTSMAGIISLIHQMMKGDGTNSEIPNENSGQLGHHYPNEPPRHLVDRPLGITNPEDQALVNLDHHQMRHAMFPQYQSSQIIGQPIQASQIIGQQNQVTSPTDAIVALMGQGMDSIDERGRIHTTTRPH